MEGKKYPQRTLRQNKALHKYFANIADELNSHGLSIMKTLRSDAEVQWSPSLVKELIWRPVMKAQLQKTSTTEMTTKEIDEVLDTLTKYFGEKHGLSINFPSIEVLLNNMRAEEGYK